MSSSADSPESKPHHQLYWKTYILIGIMVVAGPVGNLLLKQSVSDFGKLKFWPPANWWPLFVQIFGGITVWAGIACLIAFIVAYMLALSIADYSYVQPAAALGYGLGALLGYIFLHEKVSALSWFGIAIICFGVAFIRNTKPRTTENPN
jgi:drug/metabolite transporter (DMT)-like permease